MNRRSFDPTSPVDRMIMRHRINTGWEPIPGVYWAVCAYCLPSRSMQSSRTFLTYARADSAQEALEEVLGRPEVALADFTQMDVIIVVLDDIVTEADIPEWRKQRAAWVASQREKRWMT